MSELIKEYRLAKKQISKKLAQSIHSKIIDKGSNINEGDSAYKGFDQHFMENWNLFQSKSIYIFVNELVNFFRTVDSFGDKINSYKIQNTCLIISDDNKKSKAKEIVFSSDKGYSFSIVGDLSYFGFGHCSLDIKSCENNGFEGKLKVNHISNHPITNKYRRPYGWYNALFSMFFIEKISKIDPIYKYDGNLSFDMENYLIKIAISNIDVINNLNNQLSFSMKRK